MNTRTVSLVGLAVILAAVYVTFFTDWRKHKKIQIYWTQSRSGPPTIMFYLDKEYALTSVKVVPAEEARTNKYAHALWDIVAASNSAPTKTFDYGQNIPGMKPVVPTAQPEPLDADTRYCLLIEAQNNLKGEITFEPP
ncbi:MAG: hypothetical protein ABSG59_17220 [Verrucomicrobiota bacterium]|jgi:hypothetical protein